MNDLITIIIPTYNYDKYIRKCLDSIVSQTYNNLEIIVIDDGSNDNTESICEEYLQKDNRIKYLYQDHLGVANARNFGINKSNGKYIMFVDSDDYLMSNNYIEIMHNELVNNYESFAISGYSYVKNNKVINKELYKSKTVKLSYDDIKFDFIRSNALITCHNIIVERSVLEGIRFHNDLDFAEDFYFMFAILLRVREFIYVANVDYAYVQYEFTVTRNNNLNNIITYLNDTKFVLESITKVDYSLKDATTIRMQEKTNYAYKKLSINKSFKQFKEDYNILVGKYPVEKYDFSKSKESFPNKLRMFLLVHKRLFLYYLVNNIINKIH